MPLYDYRCTACGRVVEVLHGINEQGPRPCTACGGVMSKMFSAPAIHFKGSGWAKKDAATKARKSSATEKATGPADDAAKPAAGAKTTAEPSKGVGSKGDDGGATPTTTKSD